MRKILLTVLGSAAMLVVVGQAANAKEQHHVSRHVEQRPAIFTDTHARDANAQYRVGPQFDASRYSGGFSAPAGR